MFNNVTCPLQMCPMLMGRMDMDMEPMSTEGMYGDEDEKDEKYFMDMYPESCMRIMPYVLEVLDNMEQKDDSLYDGYPDKDMIRSMMDRAYKNMAADMPDMADDEGEERQFGPGRFARDLAGALLLNELLRRRRRRRYGYDFGGYYNPVYYDMGYYGYY